MILLRFELRAIIMSLLGIAPSSSASKVDMLSNTPQTQIDYYDSLFEYFTKLGEKKNLYINF